MDATSASTPIATDAEMRGRTLDDDFTLSPARQFYENPGATPNLRGVEANTNPGKGDSQGMVPSTGETPQPDPIGDEPAYGDAGNVYAGDGSTGMSVPGRVQEVGTVNPDQHANSNSAASMNGGDGG